MEKACKNCRHWKKPEYGYGECDQLKMGDYVSIECEGGWDGCYITEVTTDEEFFCAYFETPNTKQGD